ncbi:protein-disulfide reductase DsbD [Parapusillimonas granuli]|uniref:Thiol:disulfide interchange protein DsbD n=1 Tax=Parapusillimonas granuli TaxID=380911 RepID=A0A853G0K7_9BURK|nr:protein-disulfide reductase DsbD [Parapusillimonas granuli]MBB5216279.1 thiol:disulfide interchange protein DsbD [Parapusillimonas granuli]NYT47956.1 protein-disulfide reductase DsbD [Parapusillimonas granuli]
MLQYPRRLALLLAWLLLLPVLAVLAPGAAHAEEDFLPPEKAFVLSVANVSPTELALHFRIAPKYYMYRERFAFATQPEAAAQSLGQPRYPQGIVKYDPTFEQDLEVYYGQVLVSLPLAPGEARPFTLAVTSQGCADAGLCYPPMTQEFTLTPVAGGYQAEGAGVVAQLPASAFAPPAGAPEAQGLAGALKLGDTGFADYLAQAGWLQVVLLCLLLGLLLSFTPCVLPMVPILLAILAGDAAGARPASRWKGLSLAAVFVLGMSLVYTALGIAAGLVGASLAAWLQTPWVLALFALLLTALALAMFDVFTLQVPAGMQTALNRRLSAIPGGRHGGVFLMGMISAFIVGPCIAAPLAGVLLFISQTGDLVLGGAALFALAWGEGLLLLAVGASSGLLLPRAGPWMNSVKHLFGVLLIATAWWMVNSILPAWLYLLGWALLALWAAALMGAFSAAAAEAGPARHLGRALGLLLALWAAAVVVGVAAGGRELFRPLAPFTAPAGVAAGSGAQAAPPAFTRVSSLRELDSILANAGKPVMLDFYADWCVSCIEMEKFTFSDPGVAALMERFVLVQADVTRNTPEDRELLKRFRLFGPPGIIFFDRQGAELADARVVGFKNAREFTAVLSRALGG